MSIGQTNQSFIVYPVDHATILVIDQFDCVRMIGRITTQWILDGHVLFLVFEVNDLDAFPSGVFSGRDYRKPNVRSCKIFILLSALEHKCNSDQKVQQVQKVLMIFVGAETSSLHCLFNFLERVKANLTLIRERPKVNTRISDLAKFLVEHGHIRSR